MTLIIISIVSLVSSLLTFFSGFGLGTLLSGVLFIFFEVEIALVITTIVHFANNVFKLILVRKNIDKSLFYKFGLYSIIGSVTGACLFYVVKEIPHFYFYKIGSKIFYMTWIKMMLGIILIYFALSEIFSNLNIRSLSDKESDILIRNGGLISGFFGGLSGHQGALRSAFMIQLNLTKECFIATGVAVACLVDMTRLPVYINSINYNTITEQKYIIIAAILSAFAGAYIGSKVLKKTTMKSLQYLVVCLLFLIGIALLSGLI